MQESGLVSISSRNSLRFRGKEEVLSYEVKLGYIKISFR